jgi:hypothetical protein
VVSGTRPPATFGDPSGVKGIAEQKQQPKAPVSKPGISECRASRSARLIACIGVFVVASAAPLYAENLSVEILTRGHQTLTGRLTQWTADGIVVENEAVTKLATTDIASLRFPEHRLRPVEGDWLILANGDRLAASPQHVRDDEATAAWTSAPLRLAWTGPLESVAALVFHLPAAPRLRRQWLAAIENAPAGADRVQFVTGDPLSGQFEQLDGLQIAFKASFGPTPLDRQRVRWVRFDRDLQSFPKLKDAYWIVWLTDGSRITATDCRPSDNLDVQFALPLGGSLLCAQHEVVRLQRFDDRVVPLSRRQPTNVTYTPYLSGQRALRADRNVLGSPLIVRGVEAAVGLGMASAMTATYRVEPGDKEFRANVGLDDAAEGRGSARFRVEVDGRTVWTSDEVTGAMALIACPPVSLVGAKELALHVDFGQVGDVGDYADWCDAVIVRE